MPILNLRRSAAIENLPPKYKWEFLRRHPHYIRDWKMANLDAIAPPTDSCANSATFLRITGWNLHP